MVDDDLVDPLSAPGDGADKVEVVDETIEDMTAEPIDNLDIEVVDEFDEDDFDEEFDDDFEEEIVGEYDLQDDQYGEVFDKEFKSRSTKREPRKRRSSSADPPREGKAPAGFAATNGKGGASTLPVGQRNCLPTGTRDFPRQPALIRAKRRSSSPAILICQLSISVCHRRFKSPNCGWARVDKFSAALQYTGSG